MDGLVTIDLRGKGAYGSAQNAGQKIRDHIMFFGRNGFYGVQKFTSYKWDPSLVCGSIEAWRSSVNEINLGKEDWKRFKNSGYQEPPKSSFDFLEHAPVSS